MKKGKRVLAGFLAVLLVVTSFVWDFGETKAAETTSTGTEAAHVKYNFVNMSAEDKAAVESNFNAFTEGSTETKQFDELWSFGAEGLRSTKIGTGYWLKHNRAYKNFKATIKIKPEYNLAIVVGDANKTTPAAENDPAFQIWASSSTQINYQGAGKDTVHATGLKLGDLQEYTINIRLENRKVSAWIEETGTELINKYAVNSTFPDEVMIAFRFKRKAGVSEQGGYKSLEVQDLDAMEEGYTNFDYADVSALTDFDSTQLDKTTKVPVAADQSVSTQWYTGKSATLKVGEETSVPHTSANAGIKPLADTDNAYNHFLNYKRTCKNFKFSTELYYRTNIGVVLGEKNLYPTSASSKGIIFWFTGQGTIAMVGALDGSTAKVSGTNAGFSGTGTYHFRFCKQADQPAGGTAVKLNMQLIDGALTISVDGYDAVLTVKVTDVYPERTTIALWARNYTSNPGGFKSFAVENIDHEYDFTSMSADVLTDFTASQRNKSTKEFIQKNVSPSELWYTGKTATTANGTIYTSTNDGLKSIADTSVENEYGAFLYYKDSYENYKATISLRRQGNIGIVLGAQNIYPSASASQTGIIMWFPNNTYAIQGALDWNDYTYTLNGKETETGSKNNLRNIKYADSVTDGSLITVEITMIDGYLTIAVNGYSTLKVKVSSTFPREGAIGLWNRNYIKDYKGGFESFAIREVEANTGTTVDVDGYTDFDHVNTAVLDEKGFTSTRFNQSSYAVEEADQKASAHWFAGRTGTVASGGAALSQNIGLKPNTAQSDKKMTILNTPYNYKNFRISTEVYWGSSTGIVLGAKNVFPTGETDSAVRIYFNANQIQLTGGGVDYDSAMVSGDSASWNFGYAPSYIFKPAGTFTVTKGEVYKLNVEMKDGILTVWVDGYDGVLTIKTADTFKQESIALMARQYDGDGGGLKSLKVEELNDIAAVYTADEFAAYRSGDTYTAPQYKNYLFAGWFTDEACTQENAVPASATTVEGTVYAKFVPRYVLGVKAQIANYLYDNDLTNDATGAIRFVTSIDTLNYSWVGFKLSYNKGDGVQEKESASSKVYKQLFATPGDAASGTITYEPTKFCDASVYFKACTVKNISADLYNMEFTVTPFWKTLDGTIVNGDAVVKTVDQGIDSEKLDGKTALFVGDSIQKGNNTSDDAQGITVDAWAGRLKRYGVVSENVAQKGWTLTNQETSGRGQIVTQLAEAAMADYDFVLLEGGVNDVRIDQDTQDPDIAIEWGTINEDAAATFSDNTIAGAMQDLIVKTQAKFPNAKIVYIINHHFGANATNMKNYVAMVKDACRVHGITYVDLSDTESYPSLAPLTKQSPEYIPDNLHPSAAGYELSTPVIATYLRKLLTGEVADTVYVSAAGTDAIGYGTAERPYQSLNYAVNQVADNGTVYVNGTIETGTNSNTSYYLGGDGNDIEETNTKQVTIAGSDAASMIDFSGAKFLGLNMAVTLKDISVKWPTTRILAEGNRFTVEETVKQSADSSEPSVFGGSSKHSVARTDLKLYEGTYKLIVGGQAKLTVGETHVTVGKNVNPGADTSNHDYTYRLFGGSYSEGAEAEVSGDTYVTVEPGAKFSYIFGGGGVSASSKAGCTVKGETHIEYAGDAYGMYGGGYKSTVAGTNVKIMGGTVYQVFGGSEEASTTGNADVQILGGTVYRRVYGGSYNGEYNTTNFHVGGNAAVTVGEKANLALNTGGVADFGLSACSRTTVSTEGETGTVILQDGISAEPKWASYSYAEYHYLIKAGANGKVWSKGNTIYVVPNAGYTATVTSSDGTALSPTEEGGAYYALPALGSATSMTINVTFSANVE